MLRKASLTTRRLCDLTIDGYSEIGIRQIFRVIISSNKVAKMADSNKGKMIAKNDLAADSVLGKRKEPS